MAATGTYVKIYRNRLADLASDSLPYAAALLSFATWRIGEGGFHLVGGIKKPEPPNDTQTGMDAANSFGVGTNPPGYTDGGYLEKAFGAGDVVDDGAGTVTVSCILDATEPLLDDDKSLLSGNAGNPPEFFEIGIFDSSGTLVVYCTFDEVVKTSGKQVQFAINVTY